MTFDKNGPTADHLRMPAGPARDYAKLEHFIDTASDLAMFLRKDQIRMPTEHERARLLEAIDTLRLAIQRL